MVDFISSRLGRSLEEGNWWDLDFAICCKWVAFFLAVLPNILVIALEAIANESVLETGDREAIDFARRPRL